MTKLMVVGGGKMGAALVEGLLNANWMSVEDCLVVEARETTRAELERRFPGLKVAAQPDLADSVIIAVKPVDVDQACENLAEFDIQRLLSVVAGVTTSRLEALVGETTAVLRAMPNTPALLGASASAVSGGSRASEGDLLWAEQVLLSIGIVVRLPEALLDAVTGLSGSGPAYVFYLAEALIEAGVAVGLDVDVSTRLVNATILGAARMLVETGESPLDLRQAVTSPGGTTAAGIAALDEHGSNGAILEAVRRAVARSKELGAPS